MRGQQWPPVQQLVRRSILKAKSRYPRPKTVDDDYPVALVISGAQVPLTRNKFGDIIPLNDSFWFANCEYERNALEAAALQRERRKRKRVEEATNIANDKTLCYQNIIVQATNLAMT
jgi:hypothetical protein